MKPNLSDIFTSQDKKTLLQLLKALVQAVDNIDYQEPILDENGNEIPKEWFSEMYDKIKVADNEVKVDVSSTDENAYFIPISNGFKINYPANNLSYILHIYPEDGYMSLNYSDASTSEENTGLEFHPNGLIGDGNFSNNEFRLMIYSNPFDNKRYEGEWDFNKGTLAWRLPDTSKYILDLTRANENALDITYSRLNNQKKFSIYKNELINDSNINNGTLRINEDNPSGYTLINGSGIDRYYDNKLVDRFQFSSVDYTVDYAGYDGQDTYNLSLSYDDDVVNVHKITSGVHNIYSLHKNEFINDKNFIKGSTTNYSYPYSKFALLSDGWEGENGFVFDFKDGKITFSNPENTNKPQYELDVNPSLKRISIYSSSNGFQYIYPNKVKHNISLKSRVTPTANEIDINFSFYTEQSVQSIQGLRDLIDVYDGRNTCSGLFMDTNMYIAIDIYKENNTLYVDGRQVMLSGSQIVADEHITYNITESSDVTFTDVVETI